MDPFQCRVERDFVCVQGDDAESYLQSQLSNQIQGMPVRSSRWSLLLQPIGKVDAVVTDPPYGIAHASNHGASWQGIQIANDGDTTARRIGCRDR